MPFTILVPDRLKPPPDIEREVLGPEAEIILAQTHDPDAIPRAVWKRTDALLAWDEIRVDAEVLSRLERCRVISRVGTGYDNIDLARAGELGIPVLNLPDYGTNDVADSTLSMLLALYHDLITYSWGVKQGNQHWRWTGLASPRRVTDQRLGIVGLGRIGTAVALRAKAFGFQVTFYDPYLPRGYDKALGVTRLEWDELVAQSDAITFHVPLTSETREMAGSQFFAHCKPGLYLVNTSRGPVVELDALEQALRSGRVAAAALDVTPVEPPPSEQPLLRAWRNDEPWIRHRLIVTPHVAFYNPQSYAELRRRGAQQALDVLNGKPLYNCVNTQWLKDRRR